MSQVLEDLRRANPGLEILPVSHPAFMRYGRVHNEFNAQGLIDFMKENAKPAQKRVYYEPSVPGLEKQTQILGEIALKVYGGMPIQAGWCYGYNTKLNGLEYHKGNEVAIAATDMVLLLGHMDDITWGEDFCFDSKKVVAFFVEAGTVVEQFATTLHFAPNQAKKDEPFITAIILPKGTNLPLSSPAPAEGESKMLTAVNKWLLVHPDLGFGYPGIQGENIEVKPAE